MFTTLRRCLGLVVITFLILTVLCWWLLTHQLNMYPGEYITSVITGNSPGAPLSTGVPNQVLYYWCGDRKFTFENYLSIMSVIRILKPDNIYFLHQTMPKDEANSWLYDVGRDYPFLWFENMTDSDGCSPHPDYRKASILDNLGARGGVYVHENTVLTHRVLELLNESFVDALSPETHRGFIIASPIATARRGAGHQLQTVPPCIDSDATLSTSGAYCVNIKHQISARDTWRMSGTAGSVFRFAAYGQTSLIQAEPDFTKLAPNIAHYMWYRNGHGSMDLAFYLSVLSVLYVGEVDMVYIHGEAPTGRYWDRIKDHQKLVVKPRARDTIVFRQRVNVVQHITDVWRLDVLLKHGGLYVDTDCLLLRPLTRELRAYSATMSIPYRGAYHKTNLLQNSAMLGKPGAEFYRKYLSTMQVYRDDLWSWNSCYVPYSVLERYPRSLHVEPLFQVNCGLDGEKFCRQTAKPGDPDLNSTIILNIHPGVFIYHFPGGIPGELYHENLLKTSKSMFAEIGRFILQKAGVLL